jgi:hypothetical protein
MRWRASQCWLVLLVGVLSSGMLWAEGPELRLALEQAGENRAMIERFLEESGEQHGEFGRRAAEFLVRYMPERDLKSLDSEFLSENLSYALRARSEFGWGKQVPEDLFFNDVLPYASLDETRERWRPDLYQRCQQIVQGAKTITEAVQALNRELFNKINVHYNTGRKRPNQSPGESIAQGRATCTGLSIILVDACRAVGIPARVTGTPLWTNLRGNHTWTEIWDGEWKFTGSDEYDAKGLDRGWFVGDASRAIKSEPRHAIYSSSWKHADANFPMVWARRDRSVHAVNVTDRYAAPGDSKAEKDQLLVRVRESQGGQRLEVKAEMLDELKQVLATTTTKAGRADMNDIASLSCQPDRTYWLRLSRGDEVKQIPLRRDARGEVTLDLAWDDLPSAESSSRSPLGLLKAWLATPEAVRPDFETIDFGENGMTREEAAEAATLLWQATVASGKAAREAELAEKVITLGDHSLRFQERVFGDEPAEGHSLWISLHGGGNAPPAVNDRQWNNQIRLYELEEGIYVAPRAPTDSWNLWHQAHIDPLFQRLIDDYVVCRGVNPDRVYVLGYSAGGDGVFQLAPRMADRWAAAGMMAGHPNETQPVGLRNIGFALFMGGDDRAYQRHQKAADWKSLLAELHQADPDGYEHWVRIYPETGHWMNRRDREALPWMAQFSRNPWPRRVEWLQDDVTHQRFYWLSRGGTVAQGGQRVSARVEGQEVHLEAKGIESLGLRLSDALVDLDESVRVLAGEEVVFEGMVPRTVGAIWTSLAERVDRSSLATASLVIDLKTAGN